MDLIIGAGITGLSYALFRKNHDYIFLKKRKRLEVIAAQRNVTDMFGIIPGTSFIFGTRILRKSLWERYP